MLRGHANSQSFVRSAGYGSRFFALSLFRIRQIVYATIDKVLEISYHIPLDCSDVALPTLSKPRAAPRRP